MNHVLADRYQLVSEIARGAAGVVHRARDMITGEMVAIKVLHADAAAEPAIATAFLDEAEVLAELNHPGIVRPRDLIVNGTLMALVMDLVEGRDLRHSIMDNGTMAPRRAAGLISEVAQALAAVHTMGIVHGDVKPGNILVPADGGAARLVDFGVARRIASPDSPTHGTPDYTAPEIIDGKPSSAKSDVYGIGLVLYEALCGVSPYRGGTIDEVLERHRESIPVQPLGVPAELWKIIESCLSVNPSDRPDAEVITPMLRAVTPLLPAEAGPRIVGQPELRPRGVTAPPAESGGIIAKAAPAGFTPPSAEVPQTSVVPPVSVPLPAGTGTAKRRRPALLAGVAAGVVALAAAGVLLVTSAGAQTDPGTETKQAAEESDEESSEEPAADASPEPESSPSEESPSPDGDESSTPDDSNQDGEAGDDYDNGSDDGQSEPDVPGEDQIGSQFPGKPGGS